MDRRNLLKASLATLGSGAAVLLKAATPSQPEGPFHPLNIDNDLRRLTADSPIASGQQIEIMGSVQRSDHASPLSNVYIEIWQADANGKYAHPHDPLPIEPDPNFQFWGRTFTDSQGNYQFFSIKPGSYPADENWTRPPHIHLRFSRRGFLDLTTQLYFAGEQLNASDRLLNRLPKQERSKLIVNLKPAGGGLMRGIFNVELDPA